MCTGGGCERASIPAEKRKLKAGHVKQAFATNGADDRGTRASHHVMNEDGVVLLQGLFLEQKMHPETVTSCCWKHCSCRDNHHLLFTFSCLKQSPGCFAPSLLIHFFSFILSTFSFRLLVSAQVLIYHFFTL